MVWGPGSESTEISRQTKNKTRLGEVALHGVGEVVWGAGSGSMEREFFIDNLPFRIHFIIVMIRWTGLAPWEFEFP